MRAGGQAQRYAERDGETEKERERGREREREREREKKGWKGRRERERERGRERERESRGVEGQNPLVVSLGIPPCGGDRGMVRRGTGTSPLSRLPKYPTRGIALVLVKSVGMLSS